MNSFGKWIQGQVDHVSTYDTAINEGLKRLDEVDVEKMKEDDSFFSFWVVTNQVDGLDDEDPEYDRELKQCETFKITHAGRYDITFGRSRGGECFVDCNKLIRDPGKYLKTILFSSDNWYACCKSCEISNPTGYSIGYLLEDLTNINENYDKSDLEYTGDIIGELFEFMVNNDIDGFNKFVSRNGIEIDLKTGMISLDSSVTGSTFSITMTPEK